MPYRNHFILPGDTYKTTEQSMHFNKNEEYTVSHVFIDKNEKLFAFFKDRNGYDVIGKIYYESWQMTSATRKANEKRVLESRLLGCQGTEMEHFISNNPGGRIYYKLSTPGTVHLNNDYVLSLSRYEKESNELPIKYKNHSSKGFASHAELFKYFEKELKESDDRDFYSFHMTGVDWGVQNDIDFRYFIIKNDIKMMSYEDAKLLVNRPPKDYTDTYFRHTISDYSVEEGTELLLKFLFNKECDKQENKDLVSLILDIFQDSPSAHGSTSITKLLLGKAKKVSEKLKQYENLNPLGLKYDQLFNIIDWTESFAYLLGVFNQKRENDVQYLGNRNVDVAEMEKMKKVLK